MTEERMKQAILGCRLETTAPTLQQFADMVNAFLATFPEFANVEVSSGSEMTELNHIRLFPWAQMVPGSTCLEIEIR